MPSPPCQKRDLRGGADLGEFLGEKTQQFLGCFFGSTAMVPKSKGEKKAGQSQQPQKERCSIGLNDHDFRRNLPTIFFRGFQDNLYMSPQT